VGKKANMKFVNTILDIILPRSCVVCGHIGVNLCVECTNKIPHYFFAHCPYCLDPTKDGKTHVECFQNDGLDGLIILLPYSPEVRTIIHAAKYKNVREVMRDLILLKGAKTLLSLVKKVVPKESVFVPIPLSKERHSKRGYNQATYIADIFSEIIGISVEEDVVTRVKDTKPQSAMKTEKEKQENVKDAFVAGQKKENIILVDDIWTTGSSMFEVCRILKKNGTISVFGLVLAGHS